MVAVVQAYINHVKGVTVKINLNQFSNPQNVLLLQAAYGHAINNLSNIEWVK